MRDVRNQLEQQEINQRNFGSVYLDKKNEERPCFKLDYEQTMILVSGYSIPLRSKIVKRWMELEQPAPLTQLQVAEQLVTSLKQNEQLLLAQTVNKPKVDFYDAVTGSDTTIDMAVAAKVLNINGVGRNKMFELLRDNKVLQSNNTPYQKYVDNGCFRVVESKYNKPDGSAHVSFKTVVYQKGLDCIRRIIVEAARDNAYLQ